MSPSQNRNVVYPNQKQYGDIILYNLYTRNCASVLLLAQMQMGKSGTYWFTLLSALYTSRVKHVYIISGNRERELKKQVIADKKKYLDWFATCLQEKHTPNDVLVHIADFSRRIVILWGSQLGTSKATPPVVPDSTLIIWDESHYAQSVNNAPHQFFKQNDLLGLLNKSDASQSDERNIKLLTVSATPFSELLVIRVQASPKFSCVR